MATLLFLVEESAVDAIDTTLQPLPTRDCTCESIMVDDGPILQDMASIEMKAGREVSAKDTIRAINMIDSVTDPEKFNAFSLLVGTVDFDQLPSGVLRAHTSDNKLSSLSLPPAVFQRWNSSNEFDQWKEVIKRPIAAYRRIHLIFNFVENFCQSSAVPVKNDNAFRYWGQSEIDKKFKTIPVLEYVFVSLDTLSNLLQKSFSVSVSFVNPKQFGSTMTSGQREECLFKHYDEIMGNSTAMNEEWVGQQLKKGARRHLHWRLKLRCKQSGH